VRYIECDRCGETRMLYSGEIRPTGWICIPHVDDGRLVMIPTDEVDGVRQIRSVGDDLCPECITPDDRLDMALLEAELAVTFGPSEGSVGIRRPSGSRARAPAPVGGRSWGV
jgi:hypothetical protein